MKKAKQLIIDGHRYVCIDDIWRSPKWKPQDPRSKIFVNYDMFGGIYEVTTLEDLSDLDEAAQDLCDKKTAWDTVIRWTYLKDLPFLEDK